MRLLYLLMLGYISISYTSAQVNYKISKSNPHYADFFIGVAANMYVNAHPRIGELNGGLDLYGKALTRYRINLTYYKTLAGGSIVKSRLNRAYYEPLKPYNLGELTLGFSLIDKLKSKKTKFVLSDSKNDDTNTITTKYIKGNADHRTILEARLGYMSYRDLFGIRKSSLSSTKSGDVFTSTDSNLIGNLHSSAIVVGLSTIDVRHVIVDIKGVGTRNNRGYMEFYFDLLIASSLGFDQAVQEPTGGITVKDDIDIEKSNASGLGWRSGLLFYPGSKVGMTFRTEIGNFPGLKKMFYTNLSMGLSLSLLLEKLYRSESKDTESDG